MFIVKKFCVRCQTEIYYDDTEHLWACECIAIRTIPDEELMPSLEYIPEFWQDALGGEVCQRCGDPYDYVWHATDEVWLKIIGSEAGLRCVPCFIEEAKIQGISLWWSCAEGRYPENGE